MEARRIWAVRAGQNNEADRVFLERSQIAIGVSEVGQDASRLPPLRAAFKAAFAQSDASLKPGFIAVQAGQLFRLVHEMRIGDFIIYPRKIDRTLRWGEIASAYRFDPAMAPEYPHRRDVRWISQSSRDAFSQGALYELGSALTLFEIKSFADEFLQKFEDQTRPAGDFLALPQDDDTSQSVARDIVETTKDFISKKLKTDLKGFGMEPFVAELFRAMGYRAQTTRHVKDDGIDVIAHRDVLGIEPPILKIQVKSQGGNVGADAVKSFYANIHDRDVGIYITMGGYTEAAVVFARSRPNLKLIAGVEFVDLIQTHYDAFDLKYRQQIPLRRVLIPDVEIGDD